MNIKYKIECYQDFLDFAKIHELKSEIKSIEYLYDENDNYIGATIEVDNQ